MVLSFPENRGGFLGLVLPSITSRHGRFAWVTGSLVLYNGSVLSHGSGAQKSATKVSGLVPSETREGRLYSRFLWVC